MTVTISGLCRSGNGPFVPLDGRVAPYQPNPPFRIICKALARRVTRAFPVLAAQAPSVRRPLAAATALSTVSSLTCQREEI